MVDFLKNNPFVTMEEYKWKLSIPMIRLMSIDNTRVHYLTDKEKERKQARNIEDSKDLNSLGIDTFK